MSVFKYTLEHIDDEGSVVWSSKGERDVGAIGVSGFKKIVDVITKGLPEPPTCALCDSELVCKECGWPLNLLEEE